MLKDGKPYGDIIAPDVHSLKVKGVQLGEKFDLQIMALTKTGKGWIIRLFTFFSKQTVISACQ